MIRVIFYYNNDSHKFIQKRLFDTYEDFGYWYIKHYTKIRIDKIKED